MITDKRTQMIAEQNICVHLFEVCANLWKRNGVSL